MVYYALALIVLVVTSVTVQGIDIDAVHFASTSKPLQRSTWKAGKVGEISFSFKTNQERGILMYQGGRDGNGHFFSVGLGGGKVQLLVSLGTDNLLFIDTERTNDCKWHRVEVMRDGLGRGELIVDGRSVRLGFNDPKGNLNMGGMLQIGGVTEETQAHPFVMEQFGSSYMGCIGGLSLLSKPISLMEVAKKQPESGVELGCPDLSCPTTKPAMWPKKCESSDGEVQFSGSGSYLNFPVWTGGKKRGELYLKFKTEGGNGMLINQEGKFKDDLSVQLKGGQVVVTMNVGGGPSELTVGSDLNDNMWHELMLSREGAKLTLTVDGMNSKSVELAETKGNNTYFDADGFLSFGGAELLKDGEMSLVGCMKSIQIGTKMLDPLGDSESNNGVTAGCCVSTVEASPRIMESPTTHVATTIIPTTMEPTTMEPTTMEPTTMEPTTMKPTTMEPTTMKPTTMKPTTMKPTTAMETTTSSSTLEPCPPDDDDCVHASSGEGSATDEPGSADVTEVPSVNIITSSPKSKFKGTFKKGTFIEYTPQEPIELPNLLLLKLSITTTQEEAALLYLAVDEAKGLLVHLHNGGVALSLIEEKARRRRALYENTVVVTGTVNDGWPHSVSMEIGTSNVKTTLDHFDPEDNDLRFQLPLKVISVLLGVARVPKTPGFEGVMETAEVSGIDLLEQAANGNPDVQNTGVVIVVADPSTTMMPTKPDPSVATMTESPCTEDDEDCISGSGKEEPVVGFETEPPEPSVMVRFQKGNNIVFEPDEPIDLPDQLHLDLNFATTQEEAAIMYLSASETSGLLVHLRAGKVTLTFVNDLKKARRRRAVNSENSVVLTDKVNDGVLHSVGSSISSSTSRVETSVDGSEPSENELPFDMPDTVDSVQVGSSDVPGIPGFQGEMTAAGVGDMDIIDAVAKGHKDVKPDGIDIIRTTPQPGSTSTPRAMITTTEPTTEPDNMVTTDKPSKDPDHTTRFVGTSKAVEATTKSGQTEEPSGTDSGVDFDTKEDSSGLGGGAVAGVIIGIVIFVLLVTALMVFIVMHYQRKDEGSYTLDEETAAKNGVPNNAKAQEADGQEWYM